MGLRQQIKAWEAKGEDKQDILEIADKNGRVHKERVRYNTDERRKMRRHPEDYTLSQISQVFGRGEAERIFRGAGYDPARFDEEQEGEEEGEEEEEDEDDEEDDEDWDEDTDAE